MAISAASPASAVMSTIRNQYQEQFAKLKEAYQETGSVVGAETTYASDDGNVKISIRGMQTSDGRQYVDVHYDLAGKESETMARALGYDIDNETGRRFSADTIFGGAGMNASALIDDSGDFEELAEKYTDMALLTQDDSNAQVKSWGYGDKTFTSIEDYRAYMRPQRAADDAVRAMADKMTFSSDQDMVDFIRKTGKALGDQLRSGGTLDLSKILADIPEDALKAGIKALRASSSPESDKLIKLLSDYLDDRKRKSAQSEDNASSTARINFLA